MADIKVLQELNLLATGKVANTATLADLDAKFTATGNYSQIDQVLNSQVTAMEASLGTTATIQTIARNALGLDISATQAANANASLKAAGLDTWSKVFHWLVSDNTVLTTTLDNRADAAVNLRAQLLAKGTNGFFESAHVDAAVNNVIQGIGSTAASVNAGAENINWLAANLGPGGAFTTVNVNVPVANGALQSTRVFTDVNANGRLDAGEWNVLTDDNGNFQLSTGATGSLVAMGGVDLFTGKAFKGVLSAPAGATVVTPLSTLVEAYVNAGGSWINAESSIQTGLGLDLPAGVTLLNYNPLADLASTTASASAKATAMAALKASLQVSNSLTQLGYAIEADTGVDGAALNRSVAATLAALVQAKGSVGQTFDLSSSTNMSGLVNAHLTSGLASSASSLASIMAASNAAISASTSTTALSKTAAVTQSAIIDAIVTGVDTNTLNLVANNYTGANLNAQIAAAQPGSIAVGVSTSLSIGLSALTLPEIELVGVADSGVV